MKDHIYKIPEEEVYGDLDKLEFHVMSLCYMFTIVADHKVVRALCQCEASKKVEERKEHNPIVLLESWPRPKWYRSELCSCMKNFNPQKYQS